MSFYNGPRMLYFGSPNCHNCITSLAAIRKRVFLDDKNFQFINGDDFDNEEIQKLCDSHGVDEYPHIQIYLNGELVYEEIGKLDIDEICERMITNIQVKDIRNESKSPTDESDQSQ